MASRRSGTAPICARPSCERCTPCRRGNPNDCTRPYREGKTRQDRQPAAERRRVMQAYADAMRRELLARRS
jgi:NADH:ubiquinone oxidoreductase subunit F (NADH-binding)